MDRTGDLIQAIRVHLLVLLQACHRIPPPSNPFLILCFLPASDGLKTLGKGPKKGFGNRYPDQVLPVSGCTDRRAVPCKLPLLPQPRVSLHPPPFSSPIYSYFVPASLCRPKLSFQGKAERLASCKPGGWFTYFGCLDWDHPHHPSFLTIGGHTVHTFSHTHSHTLSLQE